MVFSIARGLKGGLLLHNATGFVDFLRVFEDGLDELSEHALHEALATRKHLLQEGNVSAVGRQQQGNIRQLLDCVQRERCEEKGREIPAKGWMRHLENPGEEQGHPPFLLLHFDSQ